MLTLPVPIPAEYFGSIEEPNAMYALGTRMNKSPCWSTTVPCIKLDVTARADAWAKWESILCMLPSPKDFQRPVKESAMQGTRSQQPA